MRFDVQTEACGRNEYNAQLRSDTLPADEVNFSNEDTFGEECDTVETDQDSEENDAETNHDALQLCLGPMLSFNPSMFAFCCIPFFFFAAFTLVLCLPFRTNHLLHQFI